MTMAARNMSGTRSRCRYADCDRDDLPEEEENFLLVMCWRRFEVALRRPTFSSCSCSSSSDLYGGGNAGDMGTCAPELDRGGAIVDKDCSSTK